MEEALVRHLEENFGMYMLVGLSLLVGTVVGAGAVLVMGQGQELKLIAYVDNLLSQIATAIPAPGSLLYQATWQGLKEIGFLYFLGLTVIGAPFVLVTIFSKGFILGFTVAFLVQEKALAGVILALVSVLPPNLLRLPALFWSGILSLSFSLGLWKGRASGSSFARQLIAYSLAMVALAIMSTLGGLVEAYLIPPVIRVVLNL
ncbi:stage II sporulation protein M [Thermanaeromonas toyohensis ToBE]|uniref:Stage II sporulation protein M n=1 Tax=Thermanaeromonas toyohensis ToBE TaxID=698762 RepID=A0A1W1VYV2_9FIRM|nr:stage II sporulation protein M [Thermanaeromonas toyohensis]SMB98545.1 stage II sporulation protein M [Thermanaeromonas toyohensis ToBE]